jgi:hypothetical protein
MEKFKGITINGVPLETAIEKIPLPTEEQREIAATKPKFYPYKSRKTRINTKAERSGPVSHLNFEIHHANYEKRMKAALETTDDPRDIFLLIMLVLISNKRRFTFKQIVEEINNCALHMKCLHLTQSDEYSIRSFLGKMTRSKLAGEGYFVSPKIGLKRTYQMTDIGYELTLDEALKMAKNVEKRTYPKREAAKADTKAAPEQREEARTNIEQMTIPLLASVSDDVKPIIQIVFSGNVTINEVHVYLNSIKENLLEKPDTP